MCRYRRCLLGQRPCTRLRPSETSARSRRSGRHSIRMLCCALGRHPGEGGVESHSVSSMDRASPRSGAGIRLLLDQMAAHMGPTVDGGFGLWKRACTRPFSRTFQIALGWGLRLNHSGEAVTARAVSPFLMHDEKLVRNAGTSSTVWNKKNLNCRARVAAASDSSRNSSGRRVQLRIHRGRE